MSNTKRLLSLLLVFAMLFSFAPAAFADDEAAEETLLVEDYAEEQLPVEDFAPDEPEQADEAELPDFDADVEETPAVDITEAETDEDEFAAEEDESEAEEPKEEAVASVKVTFVSEQTVTLSVTNESGAVMTAEEVTADGAFSAVYTLEPGTYFYSASAENLVSVENETLVVTADAPEMTVTLALKAALPYGLKGMPEGYKLSAAQLAAKQELVDNGVVAALAGLTPGVDYVDGEVMFLSEDAAYVDMVAEAYSAEVKSFSYGVAVITLKTATVLEAVTAAADLELCLPIVEPNYIQYLIPVEEEHNHQPNSFAAGTDVPQLQSWKMWYDNSPDADEYMKDPTAYNYQYMHDVVNTYEAWGASTGKGVTVAVLDIGVDSNHEDISNVVTFPGLDVSGPGPHGTHVAGIIAADRDNGIGGAGIAPDANIISVPVLNAITGSGSSDVIIRGIEACVEYNNEHEEKISIANMSLGGYVYSPLYKDAVQKAIDSGITFVVAMGNDGTNIKNFPAAYNIPGLIAVGSTTITGARSIFSNYGAWMDVSAPGSDIMSTYYNSAEPDRNYDFMSGTSMATPVVSGVCALYMSVYGNPGPVAMEKIIKGATTNGVVDASKLFIKDNSAPEIQVAANAKLEYGSEIEIYSSSVASDGGIIIYTIDGSTPSVKNGELKGTTRIYDGSIALTTENGFTAGKKVTVKAACVSGMGVMSKVASRAFTVNFAPAESVNIIKPPAFMSMEPTLVSGKSVSLSFEVYPAEAEQAVKWDFVSKKDCPGTSIDYKGVLKTAAADNGSVTVIATTKDGKLNDTFTIKIAPEVPVYKLTLDQAKISLTYPTGTTAPITFHAFDKAGKELEGKICSFKTSNPKVAVIDIDSDGNIIVVAVGKGSATITCTAQDGSNKSAKCTVTVSQLVESIEITGQDRIAPGKYATYKASVLPTNANNKKVIWEIDDESRESGVTVTTGGKVTVPASCEADSVTLSARAADSGEVLATKEITIAPMASYVKLFVADGYKFREGSIKTIDITHEIKEATLWNVRTDYWSKESGSSSENEYLDNSIPLIAVTDSSETPLLWTTSNSKVATFSQDDDGNLFVVAVAPGTATIKCTANDGSNKSASMKVKVIVPATNIAIVSGSTANGHYEKEVKDRYKNYDKIISPGKSVTNKAVISSAMGKPSAAKVEWRYYIVYVFDSNGIEYRALEEDIIKGNLITLSSSGTLTAKKDISAISSEYIVRVEVVARTVGDGSELQTSITYGVTAAPTEKVLLVDGSPNSVDLNQNYYYIDIHVRSCIGDDANNCLDYTFKTSNPNIAGAYFSPEEENLPPDADYRIIRIIANNEGKTGTAKITITATDGSNKSCSVTVKVVK